ncbi:hypothetical protein D3C78_1055540 [compost metagenome]
MRKALHFIDQHRVALLGDKQALALGVVGQAFKPLVPGHVNAQGHLLGIGGIEERRAVLQMNLDQALLTLIADHIGVGTDELHRLRVAKPHQRHAAQDFPVEGHLDQLGILVGHGEQAFTHRIKGQCRDVIVQPVDHLRLDHHLIVIERHGLLTERVQPGLQVEPGTLVKAVVLTQHTQCQQGGDQHNQGKGFGAG